MAAPSPPECYNVRAEGVFRGAGLRPFDALVMSYPKCGTNWLTSITLLLRNDGEPFSQKQTMLCGTDTEAALRSARETCGTEARQAASSLAGLLPCCSSRGPGKGRRSHNGHIGPSEFAALGPHRTIWSHARPEEAAPGRRLDIPEGTKVFVIQRNSMDACVSGFYWFDNTYPRFSDFQREFIECRRGEPHAIRVFDTQGPGHIVEWYSKWWAAKEWLGDDLLWLHYEDMQEDLGAAVKAIAAHLGIDASAEVIAKVVAAAQPNAVKSAVGMDGFRRHLRKGGTGDWKDHFSAEEATQFRAAREARISEYPAFPAERET